MLEKAPGFVRGMVESGMRKGMTAAQQDETVVLTRDDAAWRSYLGVTSGGEKDAWVVVVDGAGKMLWHGHGAAKDLEALVRGAL